ncbi:MAG: ATP synthase F1 subunit epsilon [Bacteroidetes bacterium]|uniref:ATP synthase F1 subunit epsilon n=1 Tax=Candidatus Limisoma faecipullorum TaxID=2840854 RepID=A0A9D9NK35_9BACT|nr:ATP synthase F1 subunit epsilon [Candidatus Limisoma faecipullorum]
MTLKVISAEEVMYDGKVTLVTLPGEKGLFTVLENHASLVSVLLPGDIVYEEEGGSRKTMAIEGGIADVDKNVVSVCIY